MKPLQPLIILLALLAFPKAVFAQETFESTNYATINGLISRMSATKIDGSNNAGNKLTPGTLLVYRTNEGRLGKLQMLAYGYNMRFRAVTYQSDGRIYRQNNSLTIRGTWTCDLDQLMESSSGRDFWWQQADATIRYLSPENGARFYVVPPGVRHTLKGFVDMHTHPMSHLGFGKKLMHGAPDIGSLIPAGTRDCNPRDFRARSIAEALGHCNSTHGGWGTDNGCGNYIRAAVINFALDKDFIHKSGNPHGDHHHAGYPNFAYWPHQTSLLHQQMWWEWIKRTYDGGLRVMVALAVNNELLAEVVDGDGPKDDKNSADLQIDEIISFVGRHRDFMEIARSAADLRRIVSANKLAVILGMEVDNLGNFNKPGVVCTEATVRAEIQRLHAKGVRYIFPIHLVDNKFGGTAVYEDLFNYANKYSTGRLYTVQQSTDGNVAYRLGSGSDGAGNILIKRALDAVSGVPYPPAFNFPDCILPTLGCWDKFRLIRNLVSPDSRYATYNRIPPGHVNAKGLTPIGDFAIRELMRLGMMIDIDHMSDKSAASTLTIAERYGYPVNIGHNGIRARGGKERAAPQSVVTRVAALGGVFGLGTADTNPQSFIEGFNQVWRVMGHRATAIGTDVNGLEPLPRHAPGRTSASFYSRFLSESGITTKARTGTKTWDYITDKGVSHYGLMPEFLFDVRISPGGTEVINNLMKSAEYFAQMWEKCESAFPVAGARVSTTTAFAADSQEKTSAEGVTISPDKENRLYPNSPNPFYQQTTISYQAVPSVKQVAVKIINMSGVVVKQFVNLPAGRHEISLTGNTLSPGLYVYTLNIDGHQVASRKMVLLK